MNDDNKTDFFLHLVAPKILIAMAAFVMLFRSIEYKLFVLITAIIYLWTLLFYPFFKSDESLSGTRLKRLIKCRRPLRILFGIIITCMLLLCIILTLSALLQNIVPNSWLL